MYEYQKQEWRDRWRGFKRFLKFALLSMFVCLPLEGDSDEFYAVWFISFLITYASFLIGLDMED